MKKIFSIIILLFLVAYSFSQTATISGFVKDINNSENLIGASVFMPNTTLGSVTNDNGFYSITVKTGNKIKLIASFVGYKNITREFLFRKDTVINFNMTGSNELETVTVIAERNIHKNPAVSSLQIPMKVIKLLPSISGETDVMKVFQLMPGVQSGQEGSSALYVRGGSADQNLFLVDGIPLYYVNHLGGYVSVFDDNAINSMQLIKGGFPARYGGRLSSVVVMLMKDGNPKEFHGELMLGVLSSKLFIEGPIKKGKTTFMLSARRSNIDLFTRTITSITQNNLSVAYTFYDLYGKIHHKFSDKNSLYFSIYSGRDRFSFIDKDNPENNYSNNTNNPENFNFQSHLYTNWGNQMASLRWSHLFATKLYGNFCASYSKFYYGNEMNYIVNDSSNTILLSQQQKKYNSGIKDIEFKADFDYFPSSFIKIKFGTEAVNHIFEPGMSKYLSVENSVIEDTAIGNKNINTREINIYEENEIILGNFITMNIGARASYYYTSDKKFYSVQPRAVVNFIINNNLSSKIAYSNIVQNLHLLSNSGTGVPTDTWLPPSAYLKPQVSNQYVINTTYSTKNSKFELTFEAYYKEMKNLIDFKEGASYKVTNSDWEQIIEPGGFGRAFGIEILLRKNIGKTTGWISYTLSKNERKFENINRGKFYPSTYDRRHDFALVISHRFNKKFSVSGNWVYYSGNMMTLALLNYDIQLLEPLYDDYHSPIYDLPFGIFNETGYYYGEKNNFRLPAYHRLDISFNYTKQKKRGTATWQAGIYNAYNQKNIFFLYYKNQGKDLYKFTLFPIIPSISYSFKF